jgi:hypothetical protein
MTLKKILIFTMLLFLNGIVFSQTISQLSVGFEESNAFETNINHDSLYIPSLGIDLTDYTFINGNFGVFVHTELIFPISPDFQIYDSTVTISGLFGPAYRLPIGSVFEMVFGLGFDIFGTFIRDAQKTQSFGTIKYERNEVNIGIGGDIRAKWFVYKSFYIDAGSILSWHFSSYSSVISKYGDYARFTQNYSMFSINPYIGIGLQFPFKNRGKK